MGENIRFAMKGIWSHKMRSFLTMLGVIIGIASIIAIVSTIKGTNDQIMKNLIGAGNNAVTVSLCQGGEAYDMSMGTPQGVSPLSDDQKEQIRSISGAEDASFYYSRSYLDSVRCGTQSLDMASARGIDSHYLSSSGYEAYQGRPFAESDFTSARKIGRIRGRQSDRGIRRTVYGRRCDPACGRVPAGDQFLSGLLSV